MDENHLAILPCSGLDKSLGQITRESAIAFQKKHPGIDIICPVLLSQDKDSFKEDIKDRQLIILDGCGSRCATKLAAISDGKIAMKIFLPDVIKETGKKPEKELELGPQARSVVDVVVEKMESLLATPVEEAKSETGLAAWEKGETEYYETTVDKFVLKVPKQGFYFNENDCWAEVRGNQARVGITDFLQTMASDIMFVDLPEVGMEISQFDEAGGFESGKSMLQVISPVSGKIVAVNENLSDHPELINEDPYHEGWIFQIALTDFDEDQELLINGEAYFALMEEKARREIAGRH